MRLFDTVMPMWFLPAVCWECGVKGGPQLQVLGGTKVAHVCLGCAASLGYDQVLPSVKEWLYARSTER